MADRFYALLDGLAANAADAYERARRIARERDPNHAGHIGEATWSSMLTTWGPGWPVVTRKYIVGPGGETNEVDIIVLKPDYPTALREESSVLVSGVAAAFSSKLTLKPEHIDEAIGQKKAILQAVWRPTSCVKESVSGPFPFGLLAHGATEALRKAPDFPGALQDLYERRAHGQAEPLVTSPREELDGILVATRGFVSMMRTSVVFEGVGHPLGGPTSAMVRYSADAIRPGLPIAQFLTWMHHAVNPGGRSSLQSLVHMLGADSNSGSMTKWQIDAYPDHLRDPRRLLNEFGNPMLF
ncbi:hypothetical protein GCM10009844_00460 [Nocardioides koreensis]|uniref:DUF6602 domain-containing protein n=1 Tax=Nocardioides koreensis TaxID=433651 RepID=A0ABP5KT44_9ACTN